MKYYLMTFSGSLAAVGIYLAAATAHELPRHVRAVGNELRVSVAGKGAPAVVFECFGIANLEIWSRIQNEIARDTRTVSYDHGGHWGSEPGAKPRDARQIALELRAALRNANVPPPYVLVGYSFGGIYIRVFAGLYPEEVAGLVFIDPSQEGFMEYVKAKFPRMNVVTEEDRQKQEEWGCQWESMDQASRAILPPVPMALITGVRTHDPLTRRLVPRWLEEHQKWLKGHPQARHVVTGQSGHEVLLSDPELIVQTIRQVLGAKSAENLPAARN